MNESDRERARCQVTRKSRTLTFVTEPEPLPRVIGKNARRLRVESGATLDQMAAAVGRFGIHWSTGRVGDLESGRVAPTLPTLIAVSFALGSLQKRTISLAELVETDAPIQVNNDLVMRRLAAVLSGEPLSPNMLGTEPRNVPRTAEMAAEDLLWQKRFAAHHGSPDLDQAWALALQSVDQPVTLAEQRAAKDLGVSVGQLRFAASCLWNRLFDDERDHRAGLQASVQKRGQVTRQLKSELKSAIEVLANGDD